MEVGASGRRKQFHFWRRCVPFCNTRP